jgi:hypothetical protein
LDGGPLEALSGSALNPVLPHAIGINKITVFHMDGYKGADVSTQALKPQNVLLTRMTMLSLYGIPSFCLPANVLVCH